MREAWVGLYRIEEDFYKKEELLRFFQERFHHLDCSGYLNFIYKI